MRNLRTIGRAFIVAFFVCATLLLPSPAFAQTTRPWMEINPGCVKEVDMDTGSGTESVDVATIEGFECIVVNILNIATTIIGITAFIMLLIGGFIFLFSGGNPKNTDTGKKTIGFAALGILVAISAWIIVRFIAVFTGVETIMKFDIPNYSETFKSLPRGGSK